MIDYLDEFIVEFEKSILTNESCEPFVFCCAFHDSCLRDYRYISPSKSKFDSKFYWENRNKLTPDRHLYVDHIRRILMYDMYDVVKKLHSSFLEQLQEYNLYTDSYAYCQEKIKKCSEWLRIISEGKIFKEFIDCYKNGYFQ
jgi:hypothetical protein